MCVLFVIPDTKKKKKQNNKRTRIDQIQSTFDHFRLYTTISGAERAASYGDGYMQRSKAVAFFFLEKYVHNSIDMFA